MKKIHAITATGDVVVGMEVFRQVYEAVGLGWVWRFTQWPAFRPAFDRFYDVWAGWRMRLTGRPELEEVFRQRKQILLKYSEQSDKLCDNACKIK